jgi:hypothetical protein
LSEFASSVKVGGRSYLLKVFLISLSWLVDILMMGVDATAKYFSCLLFKLRSISTVKIVLMKAGKYIMHNILTNASHQSIMI